MEFDIDVSGEDILSKDYTICIADCNNIVKGFKFPDKMIRDLCSKYNQGLYKRYKKSEKGRSAFKIRIYSIIIYYLFKSLKIKNDLYLKICRDFDGKENNIKINLEYFLRDKLNLKIEKIQFTKLDKNSNAHQYSYLMRKDKKNRMNTYFEIKLEDIEKWL